PTTDTHTLSLHDALPICSSWLSQNPHVDENRRRRDNARIIRMHFAWEQPLHALHVIASLRVRRHPPVLVDRPLAGIVRGRSQRKDRKSTRLNSSHDQISY